MDHRQTQTSTRASRPALPPCAQQEGGRFGSGRAGLGSVCERPSSDCSTSAAVFVASALPNRVWAVKLLLPRMPGREGRWKRGRDGDRRVGEDPLGVGGTTRAGGENESVLAPRGWSRKARPRRRSLRCNPTRKSGSHRRRSLRCDPTRRSGSHNGPQPRRRRRGNEERGGTAGIAQR